MAPVIRVSASILSADLARLADQVKLVEADADLIHVDVMDAHFVPPLTIGPAVVASLRPHTGLPLHAHLQVERPEGYVDELAAAGCDRVTFLVETLADPGPALRKAREAGLRPGLALGPETPVGELRRWLEDLDDVVVLSVDPGYAGQPFIPEVLPKLETLRADVERAGLGVELHVDGGVSASNARRCVQAGASVLVAASAIFGAPDPAAATRELRAAGEAA